MNKEPIKNEAGEFGLGDERVSGLLAAMKRVEAPTDFDFRVRARITAGRPAERRAFGMPMAVRYAIPLVLLVLMGAYFGFNTFFADKYVDVPAVADSTPPSAVPQIAPPSNDAAFSPANPATDERAVIRKPEVINNTVAETPLKKTPKMDRPSGGSYVESGRQERKLYPRGFDPNARPANGKVMDRTVQIPTRDILNLFGVSGSLGESGWKVESVTADTLAARSGVKAGDVIEAINDQALTEKMTIKGKFNGKSLRVRRGTETLQIILKN